MNRRTNTVFERFKAWLPWAALLTAFSAGGADARETARIAMLERSKMDRAEAVVRDSTVMAELRAIRADGAETKARVREMYCTGKPAGCR